MIFGASTPILTFLINSFRSSSLTLITIFNLKGFLSENQEMARVFLQHSFSKVSLFIVVITWLGDRHLQLTLSASCLHAHNMTPPTQPLYTSYKSHPFLNQRPYILTTLCLIPTKPHYLDMLQLYHQPLFLVNPSFFSQFKVSMTLNYNTFVVTRLLFHLNKNS